MSDPRDEPGKTGETGDGDGDDIGADESGDVRNDGDDDESGDWRFSLRDLEEAEAAEQRPQQPPIEPGSPSAENAAFVLVGVVLTLWVLFGGL